MLVLMRRRDEEIYIHCPDGSTLTVAVVRIRDGAVYLGVEAPRDYQISRDNMRGPKPCPVSFVAKSVPETSAKPAPNTTTDPAA